MIERAHMTATALGAIAVCCLATAGCAGVEHSKTAERVPAVAPAEEIAVATPYAQAMSAGVATAAPLDTAIAAIMASNCEIGRPMAWRREAIAA